jgi:hypothetical protein
MSLLNVTTETMVTLSDRWTDPKKQRKQLTALALLAPLVPVIQRAHDDLLSKQQTGSAIHAQIATLQKEQAARDKRHDRKIRGTHSVLSGFADLTDDPGSAQALLDLRDRLLPIGNRATLRSYTDEAGDAKRLPSRLDDASRKLLAKLPTPDGPLQSHVDAWLEEAKQLGLQEEQREHLTQQLEAGNGGPTAAEVVQARNAWIRAARAIEANLALDPKADAETIEKILGPLRRAEAKADRRRGSARDEATALEDAPTEDGAEPAMPESPAEPAVPVMAAPPA